MEVDEDSGELGRPGRGDRWARPNLHGWRINFSRRDIGVFGGGHTPGHVGYEIASGQQRLLDIGDLAHSSVISLKKPEWTTQLDSDSDLAKATRKATFARIAKTHELIFAPHFPYPGVGHIVVDATAYQWVPETP
jgi:glyoxylase-like metal-dependent hydrolase (beta-lactamase superfamily II)